MSSSSGTAGLGDDRNLPGGTMPKQEDITREVHGTPGPAIDVAAIERELSMLWTMHGAVDVGGAEVIPTRTSVLNLVVYAPSEEFATRATQIIAELATHHPSRVLVFTVSDDPKDFETDIDARLTSHCRIDGPERLAACVEEVTIAIPPDSLDYLLSIIAPLALPDLPTVLWWLGEPPLDDPRFHRVLLACDRLIVDSREFARHPGGLSREAEFCRQQDAACLITDLNWARLTCWRETLIQFFDIPDCRWALDFVSRVSVSFGRSQQQASNPAQALLLVGWLSERLGWQVVSGERIGPGSWEFSALEPGGRTLRIRLLAKPSPEDFDSQILAISVSASDGRRSASLEADRVGDLSVITMLARTDGQLRLRRAVRCPPPDLHRLLMSELEMTSRDRIFERALQETNRYAGWLGERGES
jgi:glucose-6-phosphate dehydrogenase assembly protein OpcA